MNQTTIDQLLAVLPRNKTIESAVSGLFFYCADKPSKAVSYIQEPSICIVLQGEREIYLGADCQRFDNSNLMFCPVNIPLSMHIKHASIKNPVIVLSMKLDLAMIRDVLAQIPTTQPVAECSSQTLRSCESNEQSHAMHGASYDLWRVTDRRLHVAHECPYRALADWS